MARLGSRQIAGYYPTPKHLLPAISSSVRWPENPRWPTYLLDPCAGEGQAILALRELWVAQWHDGSKPPTHRMYERPAVIACELEAKRAGTLRESLTDLHDRAYQGDALQLLADRENSAQATVLFLNPPYDQDPEHGRAEQRFLARFAPMLAPGAGLLLFLVPAQALSASAQYLARHFLDLRAWRFPDQDFQAFRQVLVVGRRCSKPLTDASAAETVQGWARDPHELPVLPEVCPDPLLVDLAPEPPYELSLHLAELDVTAAIEAYRPFDDQAAGLAEKTADLLGARFETAVPPKPAHIALALSSGMFNGWPLVPNDPSRHPPLLAKGVFEREHVPVSQRTDKDGNVTGIVEIEQPRLRVTVLRLDTLSFHELAPGTLPAGGDEVSGWNAADLITHYDRSLAELLRQQFPALHDPSNPGHQIALPRLARTPFEVQSEAIQASLKLLATRRNPMLVAEVGTGKSTMALMIAAALSPGHYGETVAELERIGISDRPRPVEKTLIVCPPHLLDTWKEEARAVVPNWKVQVVKRAADLDQPAELYVVSRESAKLGHAWGGVSTRCPRCGADLDHSASTNASRRRRCQAVPRRPVNLAARMAERLAALLLPAAPGHSLLRSLTHSQLLKRRYPKDAEPRPLASKALLGVAESYARELARLASDPTQTPPKPYSLGQALLSLASTLGLAGQVLELLGHPSSELPYWLEHPVESLAHLERDGDEVSSPDLSMLLKAAERLQDAGEWSEGPPCGERLFQAIPEPRRVPLAEIIQRRHRHKFQLVILDLW